MSDKLAGKIALITGGSLGIGLATAKMFVEHGAYVYITGRRRPELDAAVAEIGANVMAVKADVTNMADLDMLFAQIKKEQGRLDIVFANAGTGSPGTIDAITEDLYNIAFDTNVKGLVFTIQKALPLISDGGTIILTDRAPRSGVRVTLDAGWAFSR
jgi:NAD(P)-dependent dehydrogenase (short-subunit alcohol dehydrogenase family)